MNSKEKRLKKQARDTLHIWEQIVVLSRVRAVKAKEVEAVDARLEELLTNPLIIVRQ